MTRAVKLLKFQEQCEMSETGQKAVSMEGEGMVILLNWYAISVMSECGDVKSKENVNSVEAM